MGKRIPDVTFLYWVRPLELTARELDALSDILDANERARAATFRFDADRRAFIAAHGVARCALTYAGDEAPAGWRFERSPVGKPLVAGGDGPHFSLTHTRGLVACAVGTAPLGIDAESIDRMGLDDVLLNATCTAAEAALVRDQPEPARAGVFTTLWTLKEACFKAGLAGEAFAPSRIDTLAAAQEWSYAAFAPSRTHVIGVASTGADARLDIRQWDGCVPGRARQISRTAP